MESASASLPEPAPIPEAHLVAAVTRAAVAADPSAVPASAIDAVIGALHDELPSLLPSVFVLDHGRLWLVAQRGYAVVPDGIRVESGVMGRAIRLGRAQLAADVRTDPDYIGALPGIGAELAVPLRSGSALVGALNVESELPLPSGAGEIMEPLAEALAPHAAALGSSRALDLAGLARLFVHLGSLRDPDEIAALAAASLPKVLAVEASQVVLWDETGSPLELASWSADGSTKGGRLSMLELQAARAHVNPTVVCQQLDASRTSAHGPIPVVWLPLRANGEELGALVGVSRGEAAHADPAQLDTAAVLAAHVAASLDAAVVLQHARQSAVTDPLTHILNRRGLEEHLETVLESAQEHRYPVSLLVMDCDDFKEINDRAGHGFGDSLLREVATVLESAVPVDAEAARLGGDEFVVVLPRAGGEDAEALGRRIRALLAEGLTEAGFPLRISAGISTFPLDGGNATALLRAADQALYLAKNAGKDRVASFREVVHPEATHSGVRNEEKHERRTIVRSDGSVLAEVVDATAAIEVEESAEGVCDRLCKALVFVVGATACVVSRFTDGYLVEVSSHALRDVALGEDVAYQVSDFPLTAEVLATGEPRAVSFLDGSVDPAEAYLLRELEMNALLMLPLQVGGRSWGLVELYEMRLRRFSEDEIAIGHFLTSHAERRLEAVGSGSERSPRPAVYELPPDDRSSSTT